MKLKLSRKTIRILTAGQVRTVIGGQDIPEVMWDTDWVTVCKGDNCAEETDYCETGGGGTGGGGTGGGGTNTCPGGTCGHACSGTC